MNPTVLNEWILRPPFLAALLLAAAFAGSAFAARLLTKSGAAATFLVGLVVFGMGGGGFAVPLLTFFLTSSLLSRLTKNLRPASNRQEAKGATRDAAQVWANGGMATLLTLGFSYYVRIWPPYQTRYLMMLFLIALATVNADTWATEIGKLSEAVPRLLTNWKPVPAGTSGAISLPGTLGAAAGALIIPLAARLLWTNLTVIEILAVAWAGFLGSLIDSVLGATVQAQYRDAATGETTERTERGGQAAIRVRGLAWVNNDVVNFLASAGGVLCGYILLRYGAYRVF